MATLTVQDTVQTGLAPVFSAVSSSDVFTNDGRTVVEVKNGNASADTVTINSIRACNQGFDHDAGGSVPGTTGDRIYGPFDPARFNDSNGQITITHSITATVTCAVFRLPAAS